MNTINPIAHLESSTLNAAINNSVVIKNRDSQIFNSTLFVAKLRAQRVKITDTVQVIRKFTDGSLLIQDNITSMCYKLNGLEIKVGKVVKTKFRYDKRNSIVLTF